MVLVWYTVKKSSGNLREQVKSYSYIVVCTFKLQTNRSLKLQIIMQKLLSKISRIFFTVISSLDVHLAPKNLERYLLSVLCNATRLPAPNGGRGRGGLARNAALNKLRTQQPQRALF